MGYTPHLRLDLGTRCFWSFSMKYYYLNVGEPDVHERQVFGLFHEKETNLYICRGTALVALKLDIENSPESSDDAISHASWRVVVLSCNKEMARSDGPICSGIVAYFWAIHYELAWIRRNLRHVSSQIPSLTVPSVSFFFVM